MSSHDDILINTIVKYGKRGAYIVIISTVLFELILGIISAVSFNNDLFTRYGVILDIFSGMLFLTIAYSELNKDKEHNNNCTVESEDLNVIHRSQA